MKIQKNNCYVITGGPGVGKTTLIHELSKRGYTVMPEHAREIIKHELAHNGDGLPWKNKQRYTYLMLNAAVESYHSVSRNNLDVHFFDRGILDAICYATMSKLVVSNEMDSLGKNLCYNSKVFILPPWKAIYHTDNERKQTWEEATLTFTKMKETYLNYDYEVVEVPKDTVKNRLDFIVDKLK